MLDTFFNHLPHYPGSHPTYRFTDVLPGLGQPVDGRRVESPSNHHHTVEVVHRQADIANADPLLHDRRTAGSVLALQDLPHNKTGDLYQQKHENHSNGCIKTGHLELEPNQNRKNKLYHTKTQTFPTRIMRKRNYPHGIISV